MRLIEICKDYFRHREKMNLWEMANLFPNVTGINGIVIFASSGQGMKHGPRIKVVSGNKWSNNNATIPLSGLPRVIGDNNLTQDQFAEIFRWIRLNQDLLLQYWNGDIQDTKLFIDQLQPIPPEPNNE